MLKWMSRCQLILENFYCMLWLMRAPQRAGFIFKRKKELDSLPPPSVCVFGCVGFPRRSEPTFAASALLPPSNPPTTSICSPTCSCWTRLKICPKAKMRKVPNLISLTNSNERMDRNTLSNEYKTDVERTAKHEQSPALAKWAQWSIREMLIVLQTLYWENINNKKSFNILIMFNISTCPPAKTSPQFCYLVTIPIISIIPLSSRYNKVHLCIELRFEDLCGGIATDLWKDL